MIFGVPNHRPFLIRITLLSCFVWMDLLCSGQSPAQYAKRGDAAVAENDWNLAFSYYEQGYLLDTSSFDMRAKYADAARQIKNYALAEVLYAANYEKDNGKILPDQLYWLAAMQKHNGRYEDAQRNFKKYIKKFKSSGSKELLKRAEQEAKSAVWAMDYKEKPFEGKLVHPEGMLNTIAAEIAPFPESDQLYFTSARLNADREEWHLYISQNSAAPEVITISGLPSGSQVGNFRMDGFGRCYFTVQTGAASKIFCGRLDGLFIRELYEIVAANGEGANNTMACPTVIGDRYYLFFVSDRDGGEGGKDIWYLKSAKKFDSSFEGAIEFDKVKNLGSRYNTSGDELSPWISDSVFYYSSDWLDGFGGLDVFEVKVKEFLIDKPVNAGRPINSSANDFYFIRKNKEAWFCSNREGSMVADSNATCCNDLYKITYDVPVEIEKGDPKVISLKELSNELPVVLYFHNDEPVPDSWDTTTTLTYQDAYESYLAKVPIYLKENSRGLSGEKSEEATTITNDFFELKVKDGFQDLNEFSDLLLKELEKGRSLNVSVRGFASPRAQTDYNLNLTKRRTASLVNFMKSDSSGIFLPYIEDRAENGARLTFSLLPFGEFKADKSVSDDLTDLKNSIYNRSACLERKIEIESVEEIAPTIKKIQPRLETDSFSFGLIPKLGTVKRTIQIFNDGNKPMVIDSVLAECGCTDPKLDKSIVLPGETANVEISFTPFGYKGHVVKHLMLYIAGEEPKIITFEAEVEK